MTSKHLYAVTAGLLSMSLPLSACSLGDSASTRLAEATGTSTPSATTYPTPAHPVTHAQAKAIAKAGQRLADRRTSENITDQWLAFDFCRTAGELSMLDAKAWSTVSQAEPSEQPATSQPSAEVDPERIGRTFTQVVVLTPSQADLQWGVDIFERAKACADFDGIPVETRNVAVPRAALSLVRTHEHTSLIGSAAHTAMAGALVENLLLTCVVDAATEHLAFSTATSCLSDMARAVPGSPTPR